VRVCMSSRSGHRIFGTTIDGRRVLRD
jgi:hypothetical protein